MPAALADGIVHGQYVLHRAHGLDVVHRVEHESSARTEGPDALPHLLAHFVGGAERQRALRIDASAPEDQAVADLLGKLAGIEERHKQYLVDVYKTIDPAGIDKNELESSCNAIMEGGFKVDEFIKQNEHLAKTSANLIDLSMMLEAQALDLYMRFAQKSEKEETKELLFKIGDEEKAHLRGLGKLRDEVA